MDLFNSISNIITTMTTNDDTTSTSTTITSLLITSIVLISIGLIISFILYLVLQLWGTSTYKYIKEHPKTNCDIDTFVTNTNQTNIVNPLKCSFVYRFQLGYRIPNITKPVPLECYKSKHVPGLWVSRSALQYPNKELIETKPLEDLLPRIDQHIVNKDSISRLVGIPKPTVVVATIRMGFGHHRLAYSACSWSLHNGYTTIFHDLLAIHSEESELLKNIDKLYSKFSRLASEFGGTIEKLWGNAMKQGDANALRVASMTATHLQPLLLAYPKNIPLICTHQLVALTASSIGFTNVINLVVDNYPQWFLVVPNTLNIVQGPVNYQSFLTMGVKPTELKWAGHWCPYDLVSNIEHDCTIRIKRAKSSSTIIKKRFLIPVGGAGAQKTFIVQYIKALSKLILSNQLELILNAGDHIHMKTAFVTTLDECNIPYTIIDTIQGIYEYQSKLIQSNLININANGTKEHPNVILCTFSNDYFAAVATTDILCRISDILVCKPSELAFYPIPKLHIRRVGDHEADSARRAVEIGDGTMECRTISAAMNTTHLLLQTTSDTTTTTTTNTNETTTTTTTTTSKESPWLIQMNESIISNNSKPNQPLYNGCQRAVQWAIENMEK